MFFTQFGLLFANMQWFVIVCFLVGLAFLAVEIFVPGFGFFGISGIVLLVASVVLRAVFHAENDQPVLQAFQFVLIDAIIIGLGLGFLVLAQKKGWLKKTSIFHTGTAVDEKRSDGTVDYGFLKGQEGVAATILRPSGKIEIDGAVYDAESEGFVIEKGEKIVVTEIRDGIVRVEKVDNNRK